MSAPNRDALTDSPWFWALVFSLMAFLAILAIGPKYGRRQANIEVKYQARERIVESLAERNNPTAEARSEDSEGPRDFATPGDTLVPLWPLAAILIVVALLAAVMLFRGRGRPGSLSDEALLP